MQTKIVKSTLSAGQTADAFEKEHNVKVLAIRNLPRNRKLITYQAQ